jgi:hypothetical protein
VYESERNVEAARPVQSWCAVGLGEYRIERALGDGRYEARHGVLARRVILRVSADAAALVREASALDRLRHPCVPRVYECTSTWIAIERVDVDAGAPDDPFRTVRDLAAILEHAHARGVVHGHVRAAACGWRDGETWLVDWSSATIDGDADARARDIAALGELARELAGDDLAPRLHVLVAWMTAADPARRPYAADVQNALHGDLACDDAAPPVIEDIVLPVLDPKLRWTPILGVVAVDQFGGVAEIPEPPDDETRRFSDRRPDRYRAR